MVRLLALLVCVLLSWSEAASQCPSSASAWMDTIKYAESSGSHEEKIKALDALRLLYDRCNIRQDSVYAVLIHRLGNAYQRVGNVEKAIRYTKEAVAINRPATPFAQRSFLAHSYFNLALCYNLSGLLQEAQSYYDSCISIAFQYPEKYFIALLAFEKQAFLYFQSGDYQKAVENADRGILLAQQTDDIPAHALLLMQKAQARLELGETAAAERDIVQSIELLSGSDAREEKYLANAYSVYANLLGRKRDLAAAVSYYKKAYTLNTKNGKWEQCSRDLHDLGYLYDKELNDPAKAIASYTRAVALAQQVNDNNQLAALHNNIGLVYWRQGNFRRALHYYQKGLISLSLVIGDTSWRANPSLNALKAAENDQVVATLLANKGESLLELYKKENNWEFLQYALLTFKAADKMVDYMRWKQQGDRSRLYWRERTRKCYENAIEACYLLGDTEAAFFFFEKSRAVLLNDKINELGARKYLSPEDVAGERETRVRMFTLQEALTLAAGDSVAYQEAARELYQAREALENFIKELESKYPAYYQYKYDTTVYTIDGIRTALLGNGRTLIEYFSGDRFLYALAIMPDTVVFRKLPYVDYHRHIQELSLLCSGKASLNSSYPRYKQLASVLYDSLLRPLRVKTKGIIISQDDFFIPFELLLVNRDDGNSFLLKDHAISYTYSASFLMKSATGSRSFHGTLLGVAPVDYASSTGLVSLPGADESLHNISSNFSSSVILTGESAAKHAFLEELPAYSVAHVYSHAQADSSEREPVIYFYDSLLNVSELQTLGLLQTKLMVLSACETGTGKNFRGEGVFSLARGFAAAGIPATVTTLWQIDNKATYQIMELFYKHLHLGLPADEALQRAKLEFLQNSDKEYELPYYWASTILVGDAGIIEKETIGTKLWWMLGIVVITALLIGYAVKTVNK